jgi:hypothetical protein
MANLDHGGVLGGVCCFGLRNMGEGRSAWDLYRWSNAPAEGMEVDSESVAKATGNPVGIGYNGKGGSGKGAHVPLKRTRVWAQVKA